MASALPSRLTPARKLAAGLIVALVVLALLEAIAAIADTRYQSHQKLLAALDSIERETGPTPPRPLPWPPHTIMVRVPDRGQDPDEVYVIGGRRIPGGHLTGSQGKLTPGQLDRDSRQRVFIVGESAAFGFPYAMQYSFGQLLQDRLLDTHIVLNASQISWSSSDLLPLVQRIVDEFRPAVLVLFLGNNEWQHWNGSGQVARVNRMVGVYRVLGHSRLLSAVSLRTLKTAVQQRSDRSQDAGGFQTQFELEGYRYALDHPAERYLTPDLEGWQHVARAFVTEYEKNLSAMIDCARRKKVRVILMSPAINPRLSPAWSHPQPASYNPATRTRTGALLGLAVESLERGEFPAALAAVDQAIALDPLPPIFHYVRGEVLARIGRVAEAELAYLQSRERMIGHLGGALSINQVMDRVGRQLAGDYIDLQDRFTLYERGIGGAFNEHLVADDCHPTPMGHRLIADAVMGRLR